MNLNDYLNDEDRKELAHLNATKADITRAKKRIRDRLWSRYLRAKKKKENADGKAPRS